MSIELDWQIVDEDVPEPEITPRRPKPRRKPLPRWLWLALPLILLLAAAAAVAYSTWTYRARLDQVREPVRSVAQSEAKAIAANDRVSFLAFQDPDDSAWRAMQDKRFGRLERVGLPEFGWTAMGAPPQLGDVILEPDGARVDVTYQFSVTQPLPDGPVSITLRVPQFYKPTPSGWVRAMPGADYWGRWRNVNGKFFALLYYQRDADWVEPLLPRMDNMLARMCGPLPCPPQPILVVFESSPDSMARLSGFSRGFDDGAFMVRLPSPQLFGLPADNRSRDEFYRMVGTRVIQALVQEASGHLDAGYVSCQALVRWELAHAGLTGPFITPDTAAALSTTLRAGTLYQPLGAIPLHSRAAAPQDEAMMTLALAFVEDHLGAGSVSRMMPAMETSPTLGDAISRTLRINSATLEPMWNRYLQQQAGLAPAAGPAAPRGELALWCAPDAAGRTGTSIWRIRADGTGLKQITEGRDAWPPRWSPDGQWLAYAQGNSASARVLVTEADYQILRLVAVERGGVPSVGWLPDGRLRVTGARGARVIDPDLGEEAVVTGTQHVWSPDGTRVAYLAPPYPTPIVWIADANGRDARQIAPGYRLVWSPDSKRLAFLGDSHLSPSVPITRFYASEVRIADAATGSLTTLARSDVLAQSLTVSGGESVRLEGLAWSPDGSLLATTMAWPTGSAVLVISADTGALDARWQWDWYTVVTFFQQTWSPDSHHLTVWVAPDSAQGAPGVLDVQTGRQATLPGRGYNWSPDGKWLAVLQEPSGVLLVAPDLTAMRWLDTPNCFEAAWRPGR